jgi:putative tryptophan/tyrosine transport system substrate-binding protein
MMLRIHNDAKAEVTHAKAGDLRRVTVKGCIMAVRKLGWIDGRNLRLDVRFFRDDPDRMRAYAAELVRLAPDVIVVAGAAATRALQQQTRTIPIVFVAVGDPVASGIVGSIARPEGNTTGFTNLSPSVAGKAL